MMRSRDVTAFARSATPPPNLEASTPHFKATIHDSNLNFQFPGTTTRERSTLVVLGSGVIGPGGCCAMRSIANVLLSVTAGANCSGFLLAGGAGMSAGVRR